MLIFSATASLASAHKVTIRVNKVDNERGQIGIVVFGKDNYMQYNNATWSILTEPVKGTTTVTTDLPEGKYAILVMHDENKDGMVDTNNKGIPTEPTGMSNNPVLRGFPTFEQLAFDVQNDTTVEIDLVRYDDTSGTRYECPLQQK